MHCYHCYQASGHQHNQSDVSKADVKLPGFPSGHPLRVREASQCSSYFNNSPTPGVHCQYPQILGFIQPVSVLCNSRLDLSPIIYKLIPFCVSYLLGISSNTRGPRQQTFSLFTQHPSQPLVKCQVFPDIPILLEQKANCCQGEREWISPKFLTQSFI